MRAVIRVPTTLRPLSAGAAEVEVEAASVGSALSELELRHPGFEERLFSEPGELLRFVNVFVGDDEVRALPDGLQTPLWDGAVISLVPAVAGGALVAE